MSVVIDTSSTVAWAYEEEQTDAIVMVFVQVRDFTAWVPSLWRLEVANVLQMGVREGRHSAAFPDSILAALAQMPISIDAETDEQAWYATLSIADRHQLTLYDASYLELAIRRSLPLATLDNELRVAAEREGVPLLGNNSVAVNQEF